MHDLCPPPDADDCDGFRPDLYVELSDDGDGWIVVHCDGLPLGDGGGEIVWMDRSDAERVAAGTDLPWEPDPDHPGVYAPIGGWSEVAFWDDDDCDGDGGTPGSAPDVDSLPR